jgi:hypothetical protein
LENHQKFYRGGVVRNEEVAIFNFEANDYDHRCHPENCFYIIELSEDKLQIPDRN